MVEGLAGACSAPTGWHAAVMCQPGPLSRLLSVGCNEGCRRLLQIKDLNSGTFGFVQLALDRTTGRQVAIKFIEVRGCGGVSAWGAARMVDVFATTVCWQAWRELAGLPAL